MRRLAIKSSFKKWSSNDRNQLLSSRGTSASARKAPQGPPKLPGTRPEASPRGVRGECASARKAPHGPPKLPGTRPEASPRGVRGECASARKAPQGTPKLPRTRPEASPRRVRGGPRTPICTKPTKSMRFTMVLESTFATPARNDHFSHHCADKHAFYDEFCYFYNHCAAKQPLATTFRTEMDPILSQNCPKHAQQPRSPVFYERFWLSPTPLCYEMPTLLSISADLCSERSDSEKTAALCSQTHDFPTLGVLWEARGTPGHP